MIFQDLLTSESLQTATELLGCKDYMTDIYIVRLRSLEMPPRDSFRQLHKVNLTPVPFANNVGLHNVNYKLNYGSRLCQLNDKNGKFDSKGIKFVLYTTYSTDYGEVCLVISKRGEAWKIMRAFKDAKYFKIAEVSAPILDSELLHDIQKNTINFIIKAKKRKLSLNRGLLLFGPAGNGKSSLCDWVRRLADNQQLQCQSIKGKDAIGKNIEGSFKDINFFDDIEINLLNRKHGGAAASDLLSALDGIVKDGPPKVFIFTTNEQISDIEEAFIRPGRIDIVKELKIPTPDLRRRLISEKFDSAVFGQIKEENKLEWLVEATEDFSFAAVMGINNLALIYEFNEEKISIEDVYAAFCTNMNLKNKISTKNKVGFNNLK